MNTTGKSTWLRDNTKSITVFIWSILFIAYFWNRLPDNFLSTVGAIAIWALGFYIISHYQELVNHKYRCLSCGKEFTYHNPEEAPENYFHFKHNQINEKLCSSCFNTLKPARIA